MYIVVHDNGRQCCIGPTTVEKCSDDIDKYYFSCIFI